MALESNAAVALFFKEAGYIIQTVIVETIEEVSVTAGDGFPPEYAEHLISAVMTNAPIRESPDGIAVDFTMLGTYEDYRKGFHRHAVTSDNEIVELPYINQDLKNEEDVRTTFWEDRVVGTFLYNETIYDRVETWESLNVAPEWWVLQNGSNSEPFVRPTPLAELVSAKLIGPLTILFEEAYQRAVDLADHGWAVTPVGGLRHALRSPTSGKFIKR